jgi:amino acid transporter
MEAGAPRRVLTLLDCTCLIVGIIVGAGIYQTMPDVARGAGSGPALLAIWALGGVLSLCGALGYAELATALPRAGGDVVYLGRAYGRWAGFLFGWMQTLIVRPGDIAVMAFAFATHARAALGPGAPGTQALAAAAVIGLTGANLLGVRAGKWTQNVLTLVKVGGLLAVIAAAALAGDRSATAAASTPEPGALPLRIALILVLFTYGGWNEMAYVAAEVRDPRRNLLRAVLLGTVAVCVLYLLANLACLRALGFAGLAAASAPAAAAVATVAPRYGGQLVAWLVALSALGAVGGLVFAGARIAFALGLENEGLRRLGGWSARVDAPVAALALQAAIALVLVAALGSFVETLLYTAAAVYLFYLATSVAVIVLRHREPDLPRPFRVPLYPWPTIVFAAVCAFLIHAAVTYRPVTAAVAAGLILAGVPVQRWVERRGRARRLRATCAGATPGRE